MNLSIYTWKNRGASWLVLTEPPEAVGAGQGLRSRRPGADPASHAESWAGAGLRQTAGLAVFYLFPLINAEIFGLSSHQLQEKKLKVTVGATWHSGVHTRTSPPPTWEFTGAGAPLGCPVLVRERRAGGVIPGDRSRKPADFPSTELSFLDLVQPSLPLD